ncbi:hypothetical protein [Ammoniphilus sp. 3BR4]|uniref:hypothetical protein n=1 Tax=Ammoniphilus sp. 3BR4 TaxID=3158265 RepID=UPI0034676B12
MSIIKDFLLQLMLIAVPIFFQTFFEERWQDNNKKWIKTALYAIAINLCTSFSSDE